MRNGRRDFHLKRNIKLHSYWTGLEKNNALDTEKWNNYFNLKRFNDQPPFADSLADVIASLIAFA